MIPLRVDLVDKPKNFETPSHVGQMAKRGGMFTPNEATRTLSPDALRITAMSHLSNKNDRR